jgi:hypothetical protein
LVGTITHHENKKKVKFTAKDGKAKKLNINVITKQELYLPTEASKM